MLFELFIQEVFMLKLKSTKFIIVIALLLPLCIIVALFMSRNNNNVNLKSYSTFSTQDWSNNREYRSNMLDDLFLKHKLIGISKDNIITLLGKPEYVYSDFSCGYYVGHDIADPIVLDIEFDNTDIAVKYYVSQK